MASLSVEEIDNLFEQELLLTASLTKSQQQAQGGPAGRAAPEGDDDDDGSGEPSPSGDGDRLRRAGLLANVLLASQQLWFAGSPGLDAVAERIGNSSRNCE
jgi:hypothetical protein